MILLAGGVVTYRDDTGAFPNFRLVHETDSLMQIEIMFRQKSNFYYISGCQISGCQIPGSYLVVAYQAGTSLAETPSIDLFIPKAELADMMWSVPPPSTEFASKMHDVTKVDHPAALPSTLETLATAYPDALYYTLRRGSPLFPSLPSQYAEILLASGDKTVAVTDAYLLPVLQRARLIKTEAQKSQV